MADALPPLDDLDSIFELPEDVPDNLRQMYEVIVARMRRESAHLQLNTIQVLLLERIARNYVILRLKEAANSVSEGGFAHATAQKEFNTFWLTMTQEFNRLLARQDAGSYSQMMREFAGIVNNTLEETLAGHPDLLGAARTRLADEFDQRGIA